jgi:ABC-type lipoprotein export system ATPase subunit
MQRRPGRGGTVEPRGAGLRAAGLREGTIRDRERQAAPGAAPAVRADAGPGPALRLEAVTKEYRLGAGTVRALDGLTLAIPRGRFVAVTGRSGSGKSTLLNLAAGVDVASAGEVWVDGVALGALGDDALTRLRRERIGVVYQFFNLLSTLSVQENVALPALLAGEPERDAMARAAALVADVGLAGRARSRPHMLSGGEMQRAAIARALAHRPPLVLADEPTGNLDSRAAESVLGLLRELAAREGATVVMVTHSREAAAVADRVVELRDGRVAADTGGGA